MLAGDMKLKNFLMIGGCGLFVAGVIGGGAVVLLGGTLVGRPSAIEPPPVVQIAPSPVPDAVEAPGVVVPPPGVPTTAPAPTGREVDTVALGYEGKDLGTDKLKDVTKGRPYKVNVYQDAGSATVNRVKIDLNRNDKWDEKITFKPGEISRDVAPADDEEYTEHYLWNGGWVQSSP